MNQCAPFLSGILKMIAYAFCMVGLFILFFPADQENPRHKWFIYAKSFSGVGLFFVALYLYFFC